VILCQFNENRLGVVADNVVHDVTSVLETLPSHRYPYPAGDAFIAALPGLRDKISSAMKEARTISVRDARFLSPVANPGKIVAAPVNYRKHVEESEANVSLHHNNPAHLRPIRDAGLFLKANSSLVGASQCVSIRHTDRRTDHEVELAVIIGERANRMRAEDALSVVAGYCIGLDITVRGGEDRSFRKSLDTYTVLGPWMVTADELTDPTSLDLSISVNGELRQKANTRDLILGVAELIEFATSFYTLYPGDVLLTGTPEGVGPIQPGDLMHASIDGIGEMDVQVKPA
jgi:2-keto-4-pentenoate hydratase/2-oxohepta-3-ene-1,7-dioic acid hydratase in catechol pathway